MTQQPWAYFAVPLLSNVNYLHSLVRGVQASNFTARSPFTLRLSGDSSHAALKGQTWGFSRKKAKNGESGVERQIFIASLGATAHGV